MLTILDRRCRRCGTGKLFLDEDVVTGVVDAVLRDVRRPHKRCGRAGSGARRR